MRPRADIADAVQEDYRTNLVQRVIAAAAPVEPPFEVSDPGIVVEFVKLDDIRTGDVVRFETRLSRPHHLWPETMTTDPRRPNSDTAAKKTHLFRTPEEERLTSRKNLTDAQVFGLTGRFLVAIRVRRQQLRFRCRPSGRTTPVGDLSRRTTKDSCCFGASGRSYRGSRAGLSRLAPPAVSG